MSSILPGPLSANSPSTSLLALRRTHTPGLLEQRVMGIAMPLLGIILSAFLMYIGHLGTSNYSQDSEEGKGGQFAWCAGAIIAVATAKATWNIWRTPTEAFVQTRCPHRYC